MIDKERLLREVMRSLKPRGQFSFMDFMLREAEAGATAATPATWVGETTLTNNVQAQIGITIFLPFSWEYRLPK